MLPNVAAHRILFFLFLEASYTVLTLLAASLMLKFDYAQAKPAKKPQAPQSQLRQLLDAPIYYLSFRMHITASGAGSTQGENPSSSSVSLTRDVENTITLAG